MILDLFASVMAAVGLFWLVQAFVTGRARGVWQTAERARQPAVFWLNVAVLVSFVASSLLYLAWTVVAYGVVGSTFQARHPLTLGRDMPELPVEQSAAGCQELGPRVCFVIVGVGPDVSVDELARHSSTLFGRPVGTLVPVVLTRQADGLPVVDERRRQAGADALERLVRSTYPTLWRDLDVTVLILTGHDLWVESRPGQRYAFGAVTVRPAGGGSALVSSARMDPAAYGRPPDPVLLERRMRVMVGKYLAMLLYGEKPSADPTSPVYNGIESPADLDRMQLFSPPR